MSQKTTEFSSFTANFSVADAKSLAEAIKSDYTFGGIFPNGADGDFSNPNIEKFKLKICPFWKHLKKVLIFAKIFTNEKGDALIDAIVSLGDSVCESEG